MNLELEGYCINNKWPEGIENSMDKKSKIALQVNGKTRSVIEIEKVATKEEVVSIAIKDKKIMKHINNKEVKKEIFVPEKILNLVI